MSPKFNSAVCVVSILQAPSSSFCSCRCCSILSSLVSHEWRNIDNLTLDLYHSHVVLQFSVLKLIMI
jgi:hypothetical protein